MKKLAFPYLKRSNSQSGVTITEVLVAGVVTLILVGAGMQTLITASFLRLQARQKAEAIAVIQTDLEEVKFLASQLPSTNGSINYCRPADIDSGFSTALRNAVNNRLGTDPQTVTLAGQNFQLRRNAARLNARPFNVLQLDYEVRPVAATAISGNRPIAELYTEVVPYASYECPPT
ncbi:PilW family protein [Synechococcus elongatus]|uniref:Prepilin-type cleavage/methylation domain-containing protein n=1 Tax=Synechococcus elongatus PCC 11802 TaxID=2283154 RepID=A0AAU6R555_SYNEL|nr:hypothetical protein [Synechococcus elongatus]QFZ91972.1 hypothetical protein EKO22_05870 [Synechococcus elongatus PCC 11802]